MLVFTMIIKRKRKKKKMNPTLLSPCSFFLLNRYLFQNFVDESDFAQKNFVLTIKYVSANSFLTSGFTFGDVLVLWIETFVFPASQDGEASGVGGVRLFPRTRVEVVIVQIYINKTSIIIFNVPPPLC